jgi:LysM repeat protein
MKRRTRLIVIGCAIAGTYPAAAQAASATPTAPSAGVELGIIKQAHLTMSEPSPTVSASPRVQTPVRLVAATRQAVPPPRVHAPVLRVTVKPGDTLTAIGARTSRTWEQLASYNHVPNPNLIYPDQVLSIPPANYVPVAVAAPAPAVTTVAVTRWAPPATSGRYATYTSQTNGVAHSNYVPRAASPPPASSGSGVWGCIAQHESGGNPATNTGNGYYGMYQDTIGSWQAAGGPPGLPSDYSAAVQTQVNQRIQAQQGWGAWPVTSGMCGA